MNCSHIYGDLRKLAVEIDEGIISGELYATIDTIIITPEIKSISMDKNIVKMNNDVKMAIYAIDPNNESLEYQFSPGLIKHKSDPENVFTFDVSPNHIQEPSGSITIKMAVINESNVVSPISEVEIKCIE